MLVSIYEQGKGVKQLWPFSGLIFLTAIKNSALKSQKVD